MATEVILTLMREDKGYVEGNHILMWNNEDYRGQPYPYEKR
jgi:hypothetical protein